MPLINALLIETSTERAAFALLQNGHIVVHKELEFGYRSSELLLPTIHEEIANLGFSLQNLNFIGVGNGPGSYTGLRVGVIVAKSLSFALKKPLITLSSLQCFVPRTSGNFICALDAKIGGIYMMQGRKSSEGDISYISEPSLVPLEEFAQHLSDSTTLVGPHLEPILLKLKKQGINNANIQVEETGPCIDAMYRQMVVKWQNKEYRNDNRLDINYLRKTQAEIEKEKQ
ncbi:UGMP family protein [Candidatus Rubidus massiliensis]|nr:UGMP family protein [Candidatus Rubidus massiliensis]